VTEHPTGAWRAQQIVEAFADREAAQYLIRDRDTRYSAEVRLRIKSLGMQEILTAPQSPWQNPYAERLIGSIRRECLNHYIILNARHLKRTLSSYFRYYHQSRTHLSLGKQCPFPRAALKIGKIVAMAVFITDMSVRQHSNFCADPLLASDSVSKLILFSEAPLKAVTAALSRNAQLRVHPAFPVDHCNDLACLTIHIHHNLFD
jgi:hypothetical protein